MTIVDRLRTKRIKSELLRQGFAEFLGTFVLVAFINGVIAQVTLSQGEALTGGSFFTINWGVGIGIVMGVYVSGGVSGGHINPAVTLAMATLGKCCWHQVPVYMLGQYVGAICAAGFVNLVYYDTFKKVENGTDHMFGTAGVYGTFPQQYVSTGIGFATEAVGTALLLITISAVTDKRNMQVPKGLIPFIIGLCVAGIGMAFGYNTGFALNPARDLGPRIYSALAGWPNVFSFRDYNWFWVPVVAPHVGAIIGAWTYAVLIEMHWEDEPITNTDVSEMTGSFTKTLDDVSPHHHIKRAFEDD